MISVGEVTEYWPLTFSVQFHKTGNSEFRNGWPTLTSGDGTVAGLP